MSEPDMAGTRPIAQHVEPGTYWWCACGRSKTQPFCDGSHRGSAFTPLEVTITEAREVWWCACKRSGSKPYCDGTHRTLG